MGTTKQKIKGAAEQAEGKVKKTVGRTTKNRSMEAEGYMKSATGKARRAGAKIVEQVKGSAKDIKARFRRKA